MDTAIDVFLIFMVMLDRTEWQTSRDEIEKVQDRQQREGETSGDDLEKDVRTYTEQGR